MSEKDSQEVEKLTFWQKLKNVTGVISAITGLLVALGGSGIWIFNKTDKQDKVQESVYSILANRIERLTIRTNRLLIENVEMKKRINVLDNRMYEQLKITYGPKRIDRIMEKLDKVEETEVDADAIFNYGSGGGVDNDGIKSFSGNSFEFRSYNAITPTLDDNYEETTVELEDDDKTVLDTITDKLKLKYKGAAKLPEFNNIQRMVDVKDKAIKE